MNMFYLGKHRKRKVYPILKQIKTVSYLCYLDIIWYCKWWKNLFDKILTNVTSLLPTVIDTWDMFYDRITTKIVRCVLLFYITIMIRLQSFVITNQMDIQELSWIEFLHMQPIEDKVNGEALRRT